MLNPEKNEVTVAENRKARHDYFIESTVEAGIALVGSEVKSCRAGQVQLRDAYASIQNGEMFVLGVHIAPYRESNRFNHEATRTRRLLLHKTEIRSLHEKVQLKGYTIVPLRVYFLNGRVKVELGLARGKKTHDKRDAIAARDVERDMARALRGEKQ